MQVPVHPRTGGEHIPVHRPDVRYRSLRFIPARAGNTCLGSGCRSCLRSAPVHPRTGGEHCSSDTWRPMSEPNRFIPARAGNTAEIVNGLLFGGHPVHPRTGGEHTMRLRAAGSWRSARRSARPVRPVHPRTGGEHRVQVPRVAGTGHRFIPARAGNTPSTATAAVR